MGGGAARNMEGREGGRRIEGENAVREEEVEVDCLEEGRKGIAVYTEAPLTSTQMQPAPPR